jgi:hypothetical protein
MRPGGQGAGGPEKMLAWLTGFARLGNVLIFKENPSSVSPVVESG